SVPEFLALGRIPTSGWLRDDVTNVVVKHADPGHGPRSSARTSDGSVLHDVHGHGAIRGILRGSVSGSSGCASYGFDGRGGLHRGRGTVRTATTEDQG